MSGVPSRVGPGPSRINKPAPAARLARARRSVLSEGLDHAALHGLADLGMERMVRRPVGPSLAIDPHQSAPRRFGRIGARQPRQRVRPVEAQLQPEAKTPVAPETRRTISMRSGPVESSSAWPSSARRTDRSARSSGRTTAEAPQYPRYLTRLWAVVRASWEPGSPPKGSRACGPAQVQPQRPTAADAVRTERGTGQVVELREGDGPQPDFGVGTAVDQHQHHLGGVRPDQPGERGGRAILEDRRARRRRRRAAGGANAPVRRRRARSGPRPVPPARPP